MDRTWSFYLLNVGSIPTEGTIFMKQLNCLACLLQGDNYCDMCSKLTCNVHELLHKGFCKEDKEMGCDIHTYLEVKHAEGETWDCEVLLDLGRDYTLFGLLANVRGVGGFEPKGIPKDLSWRTENHYGLAVVEGDMSYGVPKKTAQEWVRSGSSTWLTQKGSYERVSSPDWHSASWLTAKEIKEVINKYDHSTLKATYHMMKSFEEEGHQTRLVFWFDN